MTTVGSRQISVDPVEVRHVRWPDLGLTAFLVVAGLLGTGEAAAHQGLQVSVTSYVLMIAACLPIAISRWRPLYTVALTGAATVAYLGLGYAYGPILFALFYAIYRLAVLVPLRRALIATAAILGASLVALAMRPHAGLPTWSDLVAATACVALTAAVGVAVKARRDAAADIRAAQVRRAISEERLWLAQEVHDVVGHNLAVIAMQAGVALRVLDRDPDQARQALQAIRETSRDALNGVREELAALRHTQRQTTPQVKGPGAGETSSPLTPNTGLAELPALAERIRSSGLRVLVETRPIEGLPAEVDRSAYLIVQESLTNVLRHAGPGATARVRVEVDDGDLRLEVTNTSRRGASKPGTSGQGIDGMCARAEALGGSVHAGPRPEGGFAVRARLPVPVENP